LSHSISSSSKPVIILSSGSSTQGSLQTHQNNLQHLWFFSWQGVLSRGLPCMMGSPHHSKKEKNSF
jgi:hypothetical protein